MKTQDLWGVCFSVVLITFLIGVSLRGLHHGQEHDPSYYKTQQWVLGSIRVAESDWPDHPRMNLRIDVFDTAGVCVYVASSFIYGHDTGPIGTIAAVPKTQLPPGAGCQ